jgi:Tfp pilus assembly protein PilF
VTARIPSLLALPRRHPVKLLGSVLVLCLLGYVAYRAYWYWYAESQRHAAEQAQARYDFDEALEHLTACLRVQPRNAALHIQLARVARRAGHFEQAAEHLETCQQLEGVTPENALEWALLRTARGEVTDTEDLLQKQVDHGSTETAQILEALAQGYIRTYRLGNAMDCLNRLLAREPDHVRALIWRASLKESAGKAEEAEADLRRAVDVQPDHVGARSRFGEFLLRHKKAEEALHQFEYLRPGRGGDQPAVLLGLARSQRQLGATESARQVLDALLARYPQEGEALIERGQLALESESSAAAEGWFRRAIAESPLNPQAHYLLAQSLRGQGKDREAQQHEAIREGLENDRKRLEVVVVQVGKAPSDPAPRLEAGQICFRLGKEREGLRWLLSALQQAPHDRQTHAVLADYYERTGQPGLAANHRRQAQ